MNPLPAAGAGVTPFKLLKPVLLFRLLAGFRLQATTALRKSPDSVMR